MDNFFRATNLSVGYNGRAIIKDICLTIGRGEVVTLIGPNGSGKSTILKSITKHLSTISGTVFIGGEPLSEISYKQLAGKVAVVLTERMTPELMSCWDVVASGRYPYTGHMGVLTAEDEAIVADSMGKVNALDLAGRDYNAISDGQRQRVLLARAICQQPEIIVLDEPTSFLDIRHKIELLSVLRNMAKEKDITVIMSLHEIDLAAKVSDRLICVNGDKIENFGTTEEIFNDTLINKLYGLDSGSFNVAFGSVELPRPSGEVKTFVISGCGTGISIFRRLQKDGCAFAAGILFENDIDYQLAKSLASEIILENPYSFISDATFEKAVKCIDSCDRVIFAPPPKGECNTRLFDLADYAKSVGKLKAY